MALTGHYSDLPEGASEAILACDIDRGRFGCRLNRRRSGAAGRSAGMDLHLSSAHRGLSATPGCIPDLPHASGSAVTRASCRCSTTVDRRRRIARARLAGRPRRGRRDCDRPRPRRRGRRQRARARHRCRRAPRRARRRRTHHRRARLGHRRASIPPEHAALAERIAASGAAGHRVSAGDAAAGLALSAAQPHHQRPCPTRSSLSRPRRRAAR